MEHPVLAAIRRQGFTPLGWFAPGAGDGVPQPARFVILIGNAGPDMFRRFARECDVASDSLDVWTRATIERLALDLDARAIFPFDTPYPPILTWARRGGAGHISPLGLNIHPTYGLWHAYRAALLFPVAFDLPMQSAGAHPCEVCAEKPCLTACPVQAFDGKSYDSAGCVTHLAANRQGPCMTRGCSARHACPVGKNYAYHPQQAQFHMRAHLASRLKERS